MPRLTVWMVRAALVWLGLGLTFGALMLWNKGVPLAPVLWRLLPPHTELLLLGWTGQLAMGVAFWIIPRFARGPKYGREGLARAAFVALNLGLISVLAGFWFVSPALALGGRVAEALSVILFAAHLWPRVRPFAAIVADHQDKHD